LQTAFVRELNGIKYYDDSIATTPGSAIAALSAFDASKTIILGGSDKGADYREVVMACRDANATVVAIGQTGERIHELCEELGVVSVRETGKMPEVVRVATAHAKENSVVILSPASASFDQYKSYSDRGDQFVAEVEDL
jgi:UDP-N-acetylmuramoylalanine--D-glutamate ligase